MPKTLTLPAGTALHHGSHSAQVPAIRGARALRSRGGYKASGGTLDEGGLIWFSDSEETARHFATGPETHQTGIEPGEVFTVILEAPVKLRHRWEPLSATEAKRLNKALGIPDYKALQAGDSPNMGVYRAFVSSQLPFDRYETQRGEMKVIWPVALKALGYDGIFEEEGYMGGRLVVRGGPIQVALAADELQVTNPPGGDSRVLQPVSKSNPGNLFCSLDPACPEPLAIGRLRRSMLTPGEAVQEAKAELKRLRRRKQDLLNQDTRDSRRIAAKVDERIDRTKRQLMLAQQMVEEGRTASEAETVRMTKSNPSVTARRKTFTVDGRKVQATLEVDEYGFIDVDLWIGNTEVGYISLIPDEGDTAYTVTSGGLGTPIKGKGFYSQQLIPWVRKVLGKPITSHKSHQSLAAEKAWRRVPGVEETPAEFRLNPGRVAVVLQSPDGEDRILFTPRRTKRGRRVNRVHEYSEMGGRSDEHRGKDTSTVTEQSAKREIGKLMAAGWEAISYHRNPQHRSATMMTPHTRRLTADAVATLLEQQDRGSPRGYKAQEQYRGFREKGGTYIQMWMPLELLSYVPAHIDKRRSALVSEYAAKKEPFPPVLVAWDPKKGKFAVVNGNHRAAAARMRHERFIQVYVSEADFDAFTATLPATPPYLQI